MLKHWRRWLVVVVAVLLAATSIKIWRSLNQPTTMAPALKGVAVDGRVVDLARSLRSTGGKPVLVVFWATWCSDCLAEQRNIQSIARDYEVIAVAWRSEDNENVAAHMSKYGLSYPTLNDVDGVTAKAWDIMGVPDHFIVQPSGTTRFRVGGSHSEWKLRARLWWASQFPG
jgi:thiol-disulfide isomerase/thioredoxin